MDAVKFRIYFEFLDFTAGTSLFWKNAVALNTIYGVKNANVRNALALIQCSQKCARFSNRCDVIRLPRNFENCLLFRNVVIISRRIFNLVTVWLLIANLFKGALVGHR